MKFFTDEDEQIGIFLDSVNQAFPLSFRSGPDLHVMGGLSKREYFAGLAMQGMLHEYDEEWKPSIIAFNAVAMADALMEELNKKSEAK